MKSLRSICNNEIPMQLQKFDSFSALSVEALDLILKKVEETIEKQETSWNVKARLREADDYFVKILAVKTRKEAKQVAIRDAISVTRSRIEELERVVQARRDRRDACATMLSQHSLDLGTSEENIWQNIIEHKEQTEEAIAWYNRVLGFQIEDGGGVKFTFRNINKNNLMDEYSFTIRYENDTYTLLTCDPQLADTKRLMLELNKTNNFFSFVRTMRENFQMVSSAGCSLPPAVAHLETVSVSAPVRTVSTVRHESPLEKSISQGKTYPKKAKRKKWGKR